MLSLTRYAWMSVVAALFTLALKSAGSLVSHSVGLFTDALESLVNLGAALMALAVLRWAAQPPDEEHAFGHDKMEYVSSGVEGGLILMASAGMLASGVDRLLHPQPLQQLSLGLGLCLLASVVNGLVAWVLGRAGREHRSIALQADSRHLMSDVYSSLGVLVGVGFVSLTGRSWLDPAVALAVGLWVGYTGISLVVASIRGVLDPSLPPEDLARIEAVLNQYRERGLDFHALRSRQAGRSSFVQLHVLVPGGWTVSRGHDLLEELEAKLREALPGVKLHTHLEPLEDPCSFADVDL